MLLENNNIIKEKEQVASIFNEFFVNIVEHTTKQKPEIFQFTSNTDKIDQIINYYKNHISYKLINERFQESGKENFELKLSNEEDIESIILKLNSEAASGFDKISPKILKLCCNQMKKSLSALINSTIKHGKFIPYCKKAIVSPLYKNPENGSRLNKSDYRPVSVLTAFSKVFEKYYQNTMMHFTESFPSQLL